MMTVWAAEMADKYGKLTGEFNKKEAEGRKMHSREEWNVELPALEASLVDARTNRRATHAEKKYVVEQASTSWRVERKEEKSSEVPTFRFVLIL